MSAPKIPGAEGEATAAAATAKTHPDAKAADRPAGTIVGDRGIPPVNRARSLQSRASNLMALALLVCLGLGFLGWYYSRMLARPAVARQTAQSASKSRAQGEMALPSLGPIHTPAYAPKEPNAPVPAESSPLAEHTLGPAPPLATVPATYTAAPIPVGPAEGAPVRSPAELAMERRLAGPAFARASRTDGGTPASGDATSLQVRANMAGSDSGLGGLLRPTVTPAAAASVLPTRRFLLPRGAFIDCTLETAIDSTLPGMTTCITATDTFGADGTVVLLERGSKLVGETRGQVQQGTSRLFVLWTEARTPTGVVVPLASPGTDELGRAGLTGEVNRHFWDRFGAAILLTVINGAVQGVVQSQSTGSSVIVSPTSTSDVMTEVLRQTINIPPTVTKAQGDGIQVLVARDVDFEPVYALKVANRPVAVDLR